MSKADTNERKSVLKTLRISESLKRSLEKEAADEGTSVNAHANSILSRHFEWDKKMEEFGFVTVAKLAFKSIVEELDEKALARIGREVMPGMFEEMAELWFQDSTPEKILDAINARFKFDAVMHAKVTKEGEMYTIVFHHDLGRKWSILVESAARELTKRYLHVEPQISRGDSVVTVRYKLGPRNLPA